MTYTVRYVQVLETIHRWTYVDRLLPTAADQAAFDTEGGWGAQSFQLFHRGTYALCASGRWALMKFRQFDPIPLAVVEPPHGGMPNTILRGGQSTIYRGSKHKEAAALFLAFMADEHYSRQIVAIGDALPPNPLYARGEAFSRPPDHPNEWGCHDVFRRTAESIAIVQSFSPFVLPVVVERLDKDAFDDFMNDRVTAAEAVRGAAQAIDAEIARTLRENPDLRPRYEELCALQRRIDERRARGEPVPEAWLHNPFHQRYYRAMGWLAEEPEAGVGR